MSPTPTDQINRILRYTMVAFVLIAIFISWFNYRQQIALFKEKELFKLDCIANAVGFKLDAKEHNRLRAKYPGRDNLDGLLMDSIYLQYRTILDQTVKMKQLSSQMYTLVYDSLEQSYVFGVNSNPEPLWGYKYTSFPEEFQEKYEEGGILDMYSDSNGTWLSALYPIRDMDGNVSAVLQVDEKFDTYQMRAREEILWNILLSMAIVVIIGLLMFFSVRSLLVRQQRLARERLEVENLRKELLANVSHDLRTPLASIQGYLETILMKGESLDAERRNHFLNTSLKGTVKLRTLVDELFELSKLEARETKLEAEPLAINDLIQDVVRAHQISAKEQDVRLYCELPQELPMVDADIKLMDRVLNNLIDNAIKYCDPGDEVAVRAAEQNGVISVWVEDNGPGISAEDLPHIFDRFRRGKTQKSGTGLGLAIVQSILELHGAEYRIDSEPGTGTTFHFSLPVLQPVAEFR